MYFRSILISLFLISGVLRAQEYRDSLRVVWEDPSQSDSLRVLALAELNSLYYHRNYPDSALLLAKVAYQMADLGQSKYTQGVGQLILSEAYLNQGDYNGGVAYSDSAVSDLCQWKEDPLYLQALLTRARYYKLNGSGTESQVWYTKTISLAQMAKLPQIEMETYFWIARDCKDQLSLDSSLQLYSSAQSLQTNVQAPLMTALIYMGIGTAYYDAFEGDSAQKYYQLYFKEVQDLKDTALLASAYKGLALAEFRRNNILGIKKPAHQALELYEALNMFEENIYILLGKYYTSMDIPDSIIWLYKKELAHRSGELSSRNGRNLENIAVAFFNQNQTDSAEWYFFRALEMFQAIGDQEGQAAVHQQLGGMYEATGQIQKSADQLEASIKLVDTVYNKNTYLVNLWSLAQVYKSLDDYSKAIQAFEQSHRVALQLQNHSTQIKVMNDIGYTYLLMDSLPTALHYFEESLQQAIALDLPTIMGESYWFLGEAYSTMGHNDTAMVYFLKAEALLANTSVLNFYWVYSLLEIAKIHLAEGHNGLALQYAQTVYNRYDEVVELDMRTSINKIMYDAYKAVGNPGAALPHYETYIQLRDTMSVAENQRALFRLEYRMQARTDSLKYAEAQRLTAAELAVARTTARQEMLQKRWALGTGAALLLFGGLGAWFWVRYRQQQQAQRYQNSLLHSELKALRAQFNPHFLFNALASIQRYVLNHSVKEANAYLTKFSRYVRLVLHQSDRLIQPLSEELQALTGYLDIELIRLGAQFTYQVEINEDVDLEQIMVPSMLLQVFAENAIWHGLSSRNDQGGTLTIRVFGTASGWELHLEDNGIGREAARKNDTRVGHKSKGLAMVADKINLFNISRSEKLSYRIEDLYNNSGMAAGTRVVFTLAHP